MTFSKNPEKNVAIIWLVISFGSLLLAFALSVLALIFSPEISFARFFPPLLLVTLSFLGIIIAIAYLWSSRKLAALISGKGLLIHWTYRPDEIEPYIDEERKRIKKFNMVVLFFCSTFFFIGVLFCFNKNGVDYLAISEYVFLLLLTTAFLYYGAPAMGYGRAGATEFYLGKNSALFAGRFHNWGMWNSRLGNIEYVEGKPAMLRIFYSYIGGTIDNVTTQSVILNIPVPQQYEEKLKEAIRPMLQKMEVFKRSFI